MIRLSDLHQDIIATIDSDSRWSHKGLGDGFVRKVGSARTLRVLSRAGLVEGRVFTGPRGGRKVGIRLTESGKRVASRIGAIVEGYAPVDELGNFVRTVVGVTGAVTYYIEG